MEVEINARSGMEINIMWFLDQWDENAIIKLAFNYIDIDL